MTDLSTPEAALEELRRVASSLEGSDGGACASLLEDERFREWPASPYKHHVWAGGLAQHTAQVVNAGLALCRVAEMSGKPLDAAVVACAAFFHDAGKVYDYAEDPAYDHGTNHWVKTEHCALVHHVVKSAEMWDAAYRGDDPAFRLAVKHAILAHHGRREWGAAVVPATREAWAVHLADMSSVQCVEVRKAG